MHITFTKHTTEIPTALGSVLFLQQKSAVVLRVRVHTCVHGAPFVLEMPIYFHRKVACVLSRHTLIVACI